MSEREKAWTCLTSVRTTEFFRFYDQNKPHKKIASSNWTGLRLLLFLLLLHWKDQCHYAPIATAAAAAAVKLFINIIQVDRIFMCVCVRVLHLFSLSLIHSARLVSLSLSFFHWCIVFILLASFYAVFASIAFHIVIHIVETRIRFLFYLRLADIYMYEYINVLHIGRRTTATAMTTKQTTLHTRAHTDENKTEAKSHVKGRYVLVGA